MLTIDNVDLHYGAAQALRGVSLTAQAARSPACSAATASARRRCCARIVGHQPISGGAHRLGGRRASTACRRTRARARGIAYVPQGREIFPLLTVAENLETGFATARRRDASRARRGVPAVSRAEGDARPARRRSLGRPAAAARHRPRARHAAAPARCSTSRPKASSPRSSRISAAPSSYLRGQGRHGDPAGRAVFRFRPPTRRPLRRDGARRHRHVRRPRGTTRRRRPPATGDLIVRNGPTGRAWIGNSSAGRLLGLWPCAPHGLVRAIITAVEASPRFP